MQGYKKFSITPDLSEEQNINGNLCYTNLCLKLNNQTHCDITVTSVRFINLLTNRLVLLQVYDIIKSKEIIGLKIPCILEILERLNCGIDKSFMVEIITKDNAFNKNIELSILTDSTF